MICRPLTSISGFTTPDHRLTRISDKGNFISKAQCIHVDQCTADRQQYLVPMPNLTEPNLTERAGRFLSQKARPLSSMATDRGQPDTFTETRYSAVIKATQILSARSLLTNLQTIHHIIKFSWRFYEIPLCEDPTYLTLLLISILNYITFFWYPEPFTRRVFKYSVRTA